MRANPMTGAGVLADMLTASGTEVVFAYPGTSELAICESLDQSPLRLINSRGDKEAAFMAGGGSRLSPGKCAAVLHGARGLTNALGAIADLRRSEIGVLCVVGLPSRASAAFLPPHAEPELLIHAGGFAKATYECNDETTYAQTIADALQAVVTAPYGPVLLGIPDDLACTPLAGPTQSHPLNPAAAQPCGNLPAAIALAAKAEHPVILIDDYVFNSGSEVEQLLDSLAAPVFQVHYRRGPMLFQQARRARRYSPEDPATQAIMRRADVLITVEDRNMYGRVVGQLPSCRKIALTSNRAATVKNGYLGEGDVIVTGDVARTLSQLPITGASPVEHPPMGEPHPLVAAIAAALEMVDEPIVVDDSQMFGGLIARHYSALPAGMKVFGSHGGFVGSGLPTAIGMAIANPHRTVLCTLGDQGYTNALQALAAAGETDAPVVFLVCNNGSSVSLSKQSQFDGRQLSILGNNTRMDYCAIAAGFGIPATTVRWPDPALTTYLAAALKSKSAHVIELVTPGDLGFWSGVWHVEGMETTEERLPSATTTVVKVGATVRRTTGPWTPAVHDLLGHLERNGFDGAPRVRGLDDKGRDVLTYIDGQTMTRPWPPQLRTDRGLAQVGALLRRFHDAVAGYVPPAGACWAVGHIPLAPGHIVRHGDFGPWNLVWRDGRPVAIIDWDLACPGDPVLDLAQAALFTVPLQGPYGADIAGFDTMPNPSHRLRVLCDGYGGTYQPAEVLAAIGELCQLELTRMTTLDGQPWEGFRHGGRIQEYTGYQQWLKRNMDTLTGMDI